jgi:ATP synthase protein I
VTDETQRLDRAVLAKTTRKLNAQKAQGRAAGLGLGMFGMIGWSVAAPTLLGALLGAWIDHHRPGTHSWTLALLVAGLVLGCAHAGYWIAAQAAAIRRESGAR